MSKKGCSQEDRNTAREGPHRPKLEVKRIEREIQDFLNRPSKPTKGYRTSANAKTPAPLTAVSLYQPQPHPPSSVVFSPISLMAEGPSTVLKRPLCCAAENYLHHVGGRECVVSVCRHQKNIDAPQLLGPSARAVPDYTLQGIKSSHWRPPADLIVGRGGAYERLPPDALSGQPGLSW